MAVTFKSWLDARPKIKKDYSKLPADQQAAYKAAWQKDGASGAKAYMDSVGGSKPPAPKDDAFFDKWFAEHPLLKGKYDQMTPADQEVWRNTFIKKGKAAARTFMDSSLNIIDPKKAYTDVEGVAIPNPGDIPSPVLIGDKGFEVGKLQPTDYTKVDGITDTEAAKVGDISDPNYTKTDGISGSALKRVDPVGLSDYQKAPGVNQYTADDADYNMVDPMEFAGEYGEFYRGEVLKNANLADQIALKQLNTELAGLTDFATASAALKRQETSIDNAFNQAQRTKQIDEALPGMRDDLEAQRGRANTYAQGRLPDAMEDRMMELNVRSRSADMSAAAGFGAESMAAQKASTLMSAEQRLGVAQMGENLLTQNMAARSELLMAPTQYSDAGGQINTMPSQSASVLAAASLGQLNELANVSATNAMGTRVNQEQFSANLLNNISQFNASIQQDTEKFNSSLAEQQAQFDANRQTQIDQFNTQIQASENLSEAEINQRTEEFNATIATQEEQFRVNQEQARSTFNAQLAVNQNQFNATISQRTKEYNASLATQQHQFVSTLNQHLNEYNTTLAYNTIMANVGIKNTMAMAAFDYQVTYNGMVAGAVNKARDTKLQLDLAYKELAIYEEAQKQQLELERYKLQIMSDQIQADAVANKLGGSHD